MLDALPAWATLVRAPNPGPMTLTGTNSWVLRADGGVIVIDPGPLDEGHLGRLAGLGQVLAVLVTHSHYDHVEGLDRFMELTRAPVRDSWNGGGLEIAALSTPGHTADSVSYVVNDGEAVLTGDTILGAGSTVVAYPDGNLAAYLDSLRKLATLGHIPALPGHGPALADISAAASVYLQHRNTRLDQVRSALAAGARTPGDVVAAVYADTDRALWWAAELTVGAQLEYLAENGEYKAPNIPDSPGELDTPAAPRSGGRP